MKRLLWSAVLGMGLASASVTVVRAYDLFDLPTLIATVNGQERYAENDGYANGFWDNVFGGMGKIIGLAGY